MLNLQAKNVLNLIDDDYLSKLSFIYNIDKNNTKLTGRLIFKSLLRNLLLGRGVSLRSLQTLIENAPDLKNMIASKNGEKKQCIIELFIKN